MHFGLFDLILIEYESLTSNAVRTATSTVYVLEFFILRPLYISFKT